MATLFMDNFEHYGSVDHLLDGVYAESSITEITTFDGRVATETGGSFARYARYVLPAALDTVFVAGRFQMTSLPAFESRGAYLQVRNASNGIICSIYCSPTGQIVATTGNPGGTELGRTPGPVITAGVWHHIEVKFVRSSTVGSIEVRINDSDDPVLLLTGLNLGANSIAQVVHGSYGGSGTAAPPTYWTDIHFWDTSGTRNTNFLGDVRVSTLYPNEDIETGWTPNYRHNIGAGVLDTRATVSDARAGTSTADSATLELGSGDYTIETFVRFNVLPTTTQRHSIFGKWGENNNNRSWELSKCGPDLNTGNIEFRISTNGSTPTTIISLPWEPETDRWYNVCVVRASGETMLFIDGIMQGVPQTDANTYFDGAAHVAIGCQKVGNSNNAVTQTRVNGWLDEFRMTRGAARYLSNYAVTTLPYPRDGSDPEWLNVVLLCGWDSGLIDESSFARTMVALNLVAVNFPEDGFFQWQTLVSDTTAGGPRDDTNISASYYRAAAILTLGALPIDTETVTVGADVYTFVDTLANAYDVLIGVDIETTLQNLVAAINDSGGEGTIYGTGTVANLDVFAEEMVASQMKALAITAGVAGNSIGVSDTLTDGAWDDTTLTGGADIPGPSSFRLQRLPLDVTTVRSIMTVTRAYKTEAGTARVQTSFVGPLGAADSSAEVSVSIAPTYYTQVFEEDPDTSAPITPSTLLQGRVRFNRTE